MQTQDPKTWQAASLWRRWLAFNMVGLVGIGVHLGVLTTMTMGFGWNYLASTALAVEIAILHNFFWHERWTWADQIGRQFNSRMKRLARFHAANGAISFVGNLILMWFFVGTLRLNPAVAGLLAISICSLANFYASDRWVFRGENETMVLHPKNNEPTMQDDSNMDEKMELQEMSAPGARRKQRCGMLMFSFKAALAAIVLLAAQGFRLEAAELRPETVTAWNLYAAATEQRIEQELKSSKGFMALDFQSPKDQAAERKTVLSGSIPVMKLVSKNSNGENISIPSGMVHHWRGSVFIPDTTIDLVMSRIVDPSLEDTRQEDVLDSRVLDRGPDSLKLYLKLRRVKFVTVVFNTEHAIHYGWRGRSQAFSRSVATRIAEVDNASSAEEREKPIGHDRGFLWKINSYWRYEQLDGGVLVECESISLSRTIPSFLVFMVRPLIDSAARESMTRTLDSMKKRMMRAARKNQAAADHTPGETLSLSTETSLQIPHSKSD
jgi:putative flippase GtrA